MTPATFDALDAEIRSVLSPADLITPDDVRGDDPSLGHAVRTRGWPTLGAARGRIMFMLDNESDSEDVELAGHPSLQGPDPVRAVVKPGDDAAVAKLNDPIADAAKIKAALAANMLVRTRADADTGAGAHQRHEDARGRPHRRRAVREHRLRGPRPPPRPLRREDPRRQACTLQPDYRPAEVPANRHRESDPPAEPPVGGGSEGSQTVIGG